MKQKEIQILKQAELCGRQFIVYGTADEPLFLAKDVAEWLELTNVTDMVSRVDEDEVTKLNLGGLQGECNFLTENGLYEVLMQSRKPIAKQFKKGVKEILKTIRTTGGYIATKREDTPEEIMARALIVAQTTLAKRDERLRMLEEENRKQQKQIDEEAPRVLFSKAVETSKRSCLIGELTKILQQNGVSIGQNKLFKWLRENGYLCNKGEMYNQPTQKAMELGLFEIKQTVINKPDGSVVVKSTTKVAGKGQVYLVNKFLGGEVCI